MSILNLTQQLASSFETYIGVAANSIEQLRKQDVYRVLEECPLKDRLKLADYIARGRRDLAPEVKDCIEDLSSSASGPSDVEMLIQKYNQLELKDAYFQCSIYENKLRLSYDITYRRMTEKTALTHYKNQILYCNGILAKAKDEAYKYGKVVNYQLCPLTSNKEEYSEYEQSIGGYVAFDLLTKVEPPVEQNVITAPVYPHDLPKAEVVVRDTIVKPKPVHTTTFVDLGYNTRLTTPELYSQFLAQWDKVCPALGPWSLEKLKTGSTVYTCTLPEGLVRKAIRGKFKFKLSSHKGHENAVQGRDGRWYVYETEEKDTIVNQQELNGKSYRNVINVFVGNAVDGKAKIIVQVIYFRGGK